MDRIDPFLQLQRERICSMKPAKPISRKFLFLWAAMTVISAAVRSPAFAPDEKKIRTRANHKLARRFTANALMNRIPDVTVRPVWLGSGERFWYALQSGTQFTVYLVQGTPPVRDCIEVKPCFTGQGEMEFTIEERTYRYNTATRQLTPLTGSLPEEPWESRSPDGTHTIYARNYNLCLGPASGLEKAKSITSDGERFFGYEQNRDYYYTNERNKPAGQPEPANAEWSPDSRKVYVFRSDFRNVGDHWVINSLSSPRPELITFKARLPGEEPPGYDHAIFDVKSGRRIAIQGGKWTPTLYSGVVWSRDSQRLFMVRTRPDQMAAEVVAVDPVTGTVTTLWEEKPEGLVLTRPIRELEGGDLLWWSRRDGYGHYYVYDRRGHLKFRLTSGAFTVDRILSIDENQEIVYFTAWGREKGRNPYYSHLYRVRLDGSDLRLLTPEDAHHDVAISPGHNFFVDNFSRVDQAPQAVLRDMRGNLLVELETMDTAPLLEMGWKAPEIVQARADDGETGLWGVMWKPFDLEPRVKYPVVSFVYPGPQDERIPLTFFQGAVNNHVHLAQFGFVVIMTGNRGGSYKRSLAYSEYYRGNMRDYPLADNRGAIRDLAERYAFMDIDRVGIWGGSSGGFMAAAAMFTYPDFYKVGVARSGLHDPSLYHGWWNDQFQGMDAERVEGGETRWVSRKTPSNLKIAKNLKGHLLILHSEADRNCHPAHAARLVDALMAAGKRFDYFLVPGSGHGWGNRWPYEQRLIWDYFIRHLMGDHRSGVDLFEDFSEE
jgi:dipeptidyl aminopeptidase/acylaminoacyl peptidase